MGFFELFAGALAAFYAVIPSFGLGIILLTFSVRLLLLPLTIKQTRSMREMQAIQPEVKRIQAKYKGNRQKMNEEMMALYKEHGVNPLGGCLPLLLQLPFFIAIFQVVRTPLKYLGFSVPEGVDKNAVVAPTQYVVNQASGIMESLQNSSFADALRNHALQVNEFLGLRLDCSAQNALQRQDPFELGAACGSGFVSAIPYLILVLLMGLTTYYQQKQMQSRATPGDPQAQQMQMFNRIMPPLFMFLGFTFPTGAALYILSTNVWTIGQQRVMLQAVPPPTTAATGDGKVKGTAATKPESGKPAPASPTKADASATATPKRRSSTSSKKKKKKR
ncbi:MAG TPA: membrane protein insertase YidC [Actinomycetota bacterium]|nr:membrane protein insertase YidC [Actinomycetota bacterium]